MTRVKPLGDRLVVKRKKAPTSKGGILLPDSAQEKPKEGEVLAIGPGKKDKEGKLEPMQVAIGDHVLFGSYAGIEVQSDNAEEELLILSQEEVLGILATT